MMRNFVASDCSRIFLLQRKSSFRLPALNPSVLSLLDVTTNDAPRFPAWNPRRNRMLYRPTHDAAGLRDRNVRTRPVADSRRVDPPRAVPLADLCRSDARLRVGQIATQ